MSVLEVTSGFKTIHLLREKVDLLERQLQLSGVRHGVIAQSSIMKRVLETARRLASSPNPVLVWGEAGSGKRRIAHLVHAFSDRKQMKPALFHCRPGPAIDTVGALFGAERSENRKRQLSVLETASDTAVLLTHIDQLSRDGQERLADYLETGSFTPFNGVTLVKSNARIVATATVARGAGLESVLCLRLLAFFVGLDIELPALANRLEDLPQLIQHFTVEAKGDSNASTLAIEKSAFLALASYHWPGNLRELRQIVNQLVALKDAHIVAEVLKPLLSAGVYPKPTSAFSEREWIIEGLKRNRLHRGKTARSLGLSRKKQDQETTDPGVAYSHFLRTSSFEAVAPNSENFGIDSCSTQLTKSISSRILIARSSSRKYTIPSRCEPSRLSAAMTSDSLAAVNNVLNFRLANHSMRRSSISSPGFTGMPVVGRSMMDAGGKFTTPAIPAPFNNSEKSSQQAKGSIMTIAA
ncbi:sigma 54-interacting transcriptional regulator [Bradyrhizobium sp. BR 1432]|uniref:sigma 54-interacting transcriptional regulator n=1 Tax=Bradyrhizobium sp. BR 1432 TaxID=3447966 RepID=UPI003EE5F2D6